MASRPPITRKTTANRMYMMPIFLWSTVVTQSCSAFGHDVAVNSRPSSICCWAVAMESSRALMKCEQVRDDVVALPIAQAEARHEAAGFGFLRVLDPAAKVFGSVRHHACRQRLTGHEVCQVRRIAA